MLLLGRAACPVCSGPGRMCLGRSEGQRLSFQQVSGLVRPWSEGHRCPSGDVGLAQGSGGSRLPTSPGPGSPSGKCRWSSDRRLWRGWAEETLRTVPVHRGHSGTTVCLNSTVITTHPERLFSRLQRTETGHVLGLYCWSSRGWGKSCDWCWPIRWEQEPRVSFQASH